MPKKQFSRIERVEMPGQKRCDETLLHNCYSNTTTPATCRALTSRAGLIPCTSRHLLCLYCACFQNAMISSIYIPSAM
jgi:hypothetical protein